MFATNLFSMYKFKKLLFTLLVVSITSCTVNKVKTSTHPLNKVEITAHRGALRTHPENTLIAMQKAIEIGADFSELDVQETSDGVLVLYHDKNLKKTTGVDIGIWEISYDSISKLEAGAWFDPKFKGEPIPKLEDIMDEVKGKMKLNIEIKMNGHQKQLTEKVVQLVEDKKYIAHCILTSFDLNAIDKVKKLNKNIKAGYILREIPEDRDIFNSGINTISANKDMVNDAFIKKAHKHNLEVHVWIVNEPEEMKKFIQLGVDNIVTDYPEILFKVLNKN